MATQKGKITRFTDVNVVVVGPFGFIADGYDDGTAISLAPQGDRNTMRTGNDGITAFASVASRDAIWTLSLLQTSDTNDKLSAWLEAGVTQGITCTDQAGRTVLSSGSALVRQLPTTTWSAGVESWAWDILVIGVVGNVGGTKNPTP